MGILVPSGEYRHHLALDHPGTHLGNASKEPGGNGSQYLRPAGSWVGHPRAKWVQVGIIIDAEGLFLHVELC